MCHACNGRGMRAVRRGVDAYMEDCELCHGTGRVLESPRMHGDLSEHPFAQKK